MKAVVQRVISASVAVNGQTISSIGRGLLVLVGVDRYDTPADSTFIIKKVLGAKLFEDEKGAMWKKSVMDINGEVLCVSQFTLLANFKGAKPDFHESMAGSSSRDFYAAFLDEMKRSYQSEKIKVGTDGEFGAMMQVSLCNDGPVTMLFSSRDKATSGTSTPSSSAESSQKQKEREQAARAKAAKRAEFEERTKANAKRKEEARAAETARQKAKDCTSTNDTAVGQVGNGEAEGERNDLNDLRITESEDRLP